MNRSQRAMVRTLRSIQDHAKEQKNDTLNNIGRYHQDLKCDSNREKRMRRQVRDYKVAIKNNKEAVTA